MPYIDIGIESIKSTKKECQIVLKNIGGIPPPVDIVITYQDGSFETLHQTPEIWQYNPQKTIIKIKTVKKIKSVYMDGGIFMDADLRNNKMDF